jgi:hypothetical protein
VLSVAGARFKGKESARLGIHDKEEAIEDDGADGSAWDPESELPISAYNPPNPQDMVTSDFVIIVEGESDCWTAWAIAFTRSVSPAQRPLGFSSEKSATSGACLRPRRERDDTNLS